MIDIKDPKIYTFKVGEDIYDVPEDQLENFKLKVPNAQEVKTNGVAETDASVTPEPNMASTLDPGSSVSTDPKTKSEKMTAKFNPKGLNYTDLKLETDKKYKTKSSTPSGLLGELRRLRNLDEAERYEDEILNATANIPKEQYTKELANAYFDLDNIPKGRRGGRDEDFRVFPGQSIEEYLGPEKFSQYKSYNETGELIGYNDENQQQLDELQQQTEIVTKNKVQQQLLRNVPTDVKNKMTLFGEGEKFKTQEDQNKYINSTIKYVQNEDNRIKQLEVEYQIETKKYEDAFNNIQAGVTNILQNSPDGDINLASVEQQQAYNELIEKNNNLVEEYTLQSFDQKYSQLIKANNKNNLLKQDFQKNYENIVDSNILEQNLSLNYTLGARTAMAMEEFFVQGAVNFGSLAAQGYLKTIQKISLDDTKAVDQMLSVVKQNTVDYNRRIAEKRETTIPQNITLDDIGNNKVGFFDWFSESFANNSPSIATAFIPGGLAARGALGIKAAKGLGYSTMKKALQNQKAFTTLGMRTAQGIFFTGETGGKFGEIELTESSAKKQLPKLKEQLSVTTDNNRQEELKTEIEELERVSSYSFTQKAFTSYGYGTVATVAETLGTLPYLTGARSLVKKMGKQEFKKEFYNTPFNFGINVAKKTLSGLSPIVTKAMPVEILEETLTEVGHNALDVIVLDENKSLIEGVDKEFFANTAVTTLGIFAPKAGGNINNILKNEFRIKSEVDSNQDFVKELISLEESIKSGKLKGKELVEARKQKLSILESLAINDVMSMQKLAALTEEEILEAADLTRQLREIGKASYNLGTTGDLSEAGKKAKQNLIDQYKSVDKKRSQILNTSKMKARNTMNEVMETYGDAVTNPDLQYDFGLYNMYTDVAMTLMPKDGEYIVIEDVNSIDKQLAQFNPEVVKQIKSRFEAGANAAKIGNNIIINDTAIKQKIAFSLTSADGRYSAVAPLEELFHIYNKNNNVVNEQGELSEEATQAVDEAIKILNNKKELGDISEKDYNTLIQRFELYKQGGRGKVIKQDGTRGKAKVDAEEIIAQINNAVALGVLNIQDISSMPGLKGFINNLSGGLFGDASWMFRLKDGEDVFRFIKNYQNTIQQGKPIDTAPEDEDIKLSKSDSDDVQTIFEQKGKEGAFEIIEKFKPITNKIVQRRSEAPGFDRQLLTDEIETGKRGIIDLINEYDASKGVPLAAYINKFLPARAIEASNRVLDTEFKLDVTEARGVTDTTTEKVTEQVAEKPTKAKESLRKKIKLDKATIQKVVDAVTKTFGTKLPSVDSPQFKKALQKGFRTELKTTIAKDVLGSRATYETFLRDNFENIYEAIPQEIINKRFRPFAEDTGKREKTKEGKKIFKKKDITKAEFINYFLGRDVGASTKGTRKDALAEALAEEFAFDATMETIQKPEVIEKREFVDKTQTTEKVSKAIKRPVDLKFSKSELLNANESVLQKSFEISDNDFAANDKDWSVLLKILGVENLDVSGKDRKVFLEKLKTTGLIKELPEIFIRNFQGVSKARIFNKNGKNYVKKLNTEELIEVKKIKNKWKAVDGKKLPKIERLYDRQVFFKNVEEADVWIKQAKEEGYTFAPETQMWKDLFTKTPYTKTVNKKEVFSLKNKFNDIKFIKQQDNKMKALKETFLIFEKFIKKGEGKENAAVVAALLKSTSSWQGHFIRLSSPVKFYSLGQLFDTITNKKLFTEEHTLPASAVAKYLFVQAANGTVNKNFKNIERNYFQGALLNIDDNKLSGIGVDGKKFSYKSKTPDGWILEDNVWSRYFNPNVANVNFGIDPNSLMTYQGKTVYEIYGVDNAGNFIDADYNKAIAKPAVLNNEKLPSTIKFSKNNLFNNRVLDKMETLDTEAQDARIKFSKSKDLNKDFNDIIERATGIGTEKRYGQTKARAVGADKGKFNLLGIPPSAQDFVGLTRYFAGKGKQGDETIAWVKENFLDPFARANIDISNARVALANDFKALKKLLGVSPKDLNKKITGEPYTVGNAIRVYTWVQQGMTIPGLSKADQKILEDYVTADENLVTLANELIAINKDNGYPKPTDGWLAGTITTDLLSGLNTVVRAKYLKQWQNNVDEVFNETNMNKLEAAYGKGYRDALENMLGRMKTGSNRGFKGDTLTGRFIDWINNSVGAIMFFNMRSAVLQTISAVNFVNWSDNNPLKAAAAFGNQPQYWSDVIKLMNSDYLVERRNGLKINVSEADIAEIAAESKNKAKAFISKILKLGFLPTQIADSFAIASGGATFYRNRYKSLKKEGLSDKEAEAQAFQDFREIAEESQQSSRPDRISQQQAGPMGRIILAFANTPAQYARLMQKAASDLKNRRGDDKTNISKILYYGAIQNVIFNALQQALFAMAFGDEEPDEEKLNKKYTGIVNGMADSLLRGVGFHGAAISTLKNVVMKLAEGKEAQDAAIELLDISPPISSKIGKLKSAGRTWDWNKKEIREKGWSLDNPAYLAAGQVISAATNVPLDRGIRKLQNLKDASDAENEEWMRVANALGWAKWELEWQKDKPKKKSKSRTKSRTRSRTKSRTKKR